MARKGVHAKDECIGLGFGILYSAWLPKYCWEIGEHVEICLNITRLSDISIQSQVFLERTIVFMTEAGKYVSRADRIAQSGVKTLEWTMIEGDCGSADVSFSLEIPERNLVTGVLGCRKISIHYKIVVEIKACGSCLPTRTLCLPILVGINPNRSLRQRSAQSFPRRLPSHPMGASDDESLQQTALALPPGEGIHLNVQNPSCITTERSPSLSRISFASPYGGVTYNSGPRVLGAQRPSAVHYNQGRAAPEAKNLNAADDVTAIDRANCAAQNRIYETLGDTASSGCGFQTQWERNESLQPAIRISGYQDQANPETQYGAMSSSLTSVKRADNGGFVRSQSSSYHDSDYKDYYYETSNLDKEPLLPSSVKKPKKRLSTQ